MNDLIEDCFFFENKLGQSLYGCIYNRRNYVGDLGIIIVPPIGHERLRCYRECVNLARELSSSGYCVLRFDYRGEGESFGLIENTDVSSRLDDIITAVVECDKRTGIKNFCLLGFRAGAVFSLQVAQELKIKKLILCEPISNTQAYVRQLIRANIIMQRDYFGKIVKGEDEIRKDIQAGKPFSVYGFHFGSEFIQQFETIDINSLAKRYTGESLIVFFSPKKKQPKPTLVEIKKAMDVNGSCDILCSVNHFSWITKKVWNPSFPGLTQSLIDWLQSSRGHEE